MKKFLMTWYGITDLRASLGMEKGTGPILAALLAEEYSDVVILGYTNLEKSKNKLAPIVQDSSKIRDLEYDNAQQFLNQYSNTQEAHNFFLDWLKKQIQENNKDCQIYFNAILFNHLNDTEAIYEAVNQALSAVAVMEDEKIVTLYLSPGTPVMAFVWAFAALRYPNLNMRLLTSSQPDRPPENVVLPNEWLEWHGRQVHAQDTEVTGFDIILHLFGEQRIPNLLGVIQFPCKKHIFITSANFHADVMMQFLEGAEFAEITVDPYDPENVRSAILTKLGKLPSNVKVGLI